MKNISIQAGKGLGFNDNKLTTAIAESSLITKRPDGIFVGNLTGNPGQGGGTNGCDNHTVSTDHSHIVRFIECTTID